MINKKGITLIELLAVVVIISIIVMILFPVVNNLISRTQSRANERIIDMLNESTRLYQLGESKYAQDIFDGLETNSERINVLFQHGYLSALPQPLPPYPSFVWNVATQKWNTEPLIENEPLTYPNYNFSSVRLIEMIEYGATIPNGSFSDQGTFYQSSFGVMYIPNPNESYTLLLNAQILSSGSYGGFGLLFETTAIDPNALSDTGMIIQVDRGYAHGEIIIRPRTNGSEGSPLHRYGVRFNDQGDFVTSGGVKDFSNPWWTNPHTLKIVIEVTNRDINEKRVTVYIDDIYLFNYTFNSNLFGSNASSNITGFRSWGGINIAYYSLSIEQ